MTLATGFMRILWGLGYCLVPLSGIVVSALLLTGCGSMPRTRSTQLEVWPDMRRQEKFKPQAPTSLFADGRASRIPPAGTVARGYLKAENVMYTGMKSATEYDGKIPVTVNAELLKLGQTRYNVYCTPCHDRAGTGKGTVALKAPTWVPSNLHDERVKKMADGEIFDIITHGKRSMPPYRFQIQSEHDRWAIVSYVRAIQRMSSGTMDDVPAEMRTSLGDTKSPSLLPPPPPPPAPPEGDQQQPPAGAAGSGTGH